MTELKKPTPIITLPVYLRPRLAELPSSYEVKVGETLFHRFTYQPLKLWSYVDQIRDGTFYIFAPLLPLLTRSTDEALLVEERQLILTHEKDPDRQRTLLTTAILIAAQSKLFSSDFLWDLFKEDQMDLDNPVIAKLLERAYAEKLAAETQKFQEELALAEQRVVAAESEAATVRQEAESETTRREAEIAQQWQELMLKVLDHRFTSVPVALVLLLPTVKPSQRSRVSDILLDSPDAENCLQELRQVLVDCY